MPLPCPGGCTGVPMKNLLERRYKEMKKRVSALLLVLVLALSLVSPALAAEEETDASAAVTWGELTQDSPDLALPVTGEADEAVTNQEAVAYLLRWAGMEESQLGTYPGDYNAMADSMGMTDGIDSYSPTATCTQGNLAVMKQSAQVLYDALHSDTMEPLFMNGMAQPIFPYTSGAVEEGYDNANSDIIRFFVYVETNYDTDDDGKLDLVKALVQLPRAAMEGDYQAATIYEARPYITGCTSGPTPYGEEGYDISKLYSQPEARTPVGEATTEEVAAEADSSEWYYYNEYEGIYDYEDLTWYDYYLVRGYAVVECGGLGTRGSDGFETCGTDLEIDAFKCVIEWLTGDRVAYTDKTSNIAIEADWSNGKVGMTGRSYAGTTQFGLATTGVKGLETIVPVAGIASWYEYTNSQGISTRSNTAYSDSLAWMCSGRYLDPEDWATIEEKYGNYLNQIRNDQKASNGDYSDHWVSRDYTLNAENIQCPALIVHGLNDYNVRTKEFDLMYQAYEQAGIPAKILLHQDGHLTPTYPSGGLSFLIGEESYDAILNQWFSHYLYGLDNGVENMAAVTAQSNTNTMEWNTYDSWKAESAMTLTGASATEETASISSDYAAIGVDRSNWQDTFTASSTASSAMYTMDVTQDTTIKGSVAVNFSASTLNGEGEKALADRDGLMVSAMLVDIAPEGTTFPACNTAGSYVPKTTLAEGGAWQGGGLDNFDLVKLNTEEVSYKIITRGWMDLCNPDAGYDSASAANGISLVEGQAYDYTLYLQPNLYEVPAGHTLALVLYAYEPGMASYDQNYTITVDNASVAAAIPVSAAPASTVVTYTDVTSSDWFYDGVQYVSNQGIMNGVGDNLFAPNNETTRAQLVTMLYRLEGQPALGDNLDYPFSDVAADSWYGSAVYWAREHGIVTGVSETTFAPDKVLTREQMAAILYRYAQYKEYDVTASADLSGYTDAGEIMTYAQPAMAWANAAGLIGGTSATTLSPAGSAVRGQVATILMRFMENVAE